MKSQALGAPPPCPPDPEEEDPLELELLEEDELEELELPELDEELLLELDELLDELKLPCTRIVVLVVMLLESRTVTLMRLSPDWRSMKSMFQAVVPIPIPEPPRSLDQVMALRVLPPVVAAVPVRLMSGVAVV